ncbi:ribonuclease HII [Oribacterium sp. HCP3S3_B9]|uniref:ribonuclease HII n=1 Tax=Oribacterium sp. HCP3S3_B9 TaxID=3438946 RepID=UPI003F88665A
MSRELKGERLEKELARLAAMHEYENAHADVRFIAGIDEAGRGPLAGPVVAACCILPKDAVILYLNDSKKVTALRREALLPVIQEKAIAYGIGIVDEKRIDEINILQADYEAMRIAVQKTSAMLQAKGLADAPGLLLNDAVTIPGLEIPQESIIKGDAKSVSIAAASILAKVTRDQLMEAYDAQYPEYGFARNKGYGTKEHIEALKRLGPCPIHRRSFIGHFV